MRTLLVKKPPRQFHNNPSRQLLAFFGATHVWCACFNAFVRRVRAACHATSAQSHQVAVRRSPAFNSARTSWSLKYTCFCLLQSSRLPSSSHGSRTAADACLPMWLICTASCTAKVLCATCARCGSAAAGVRGPANGSFDRASRLAFVCDKCTHSCEQVSICSTHSNAVARATRCLDP